MHTLKKIIIPTTLIVLGTDVQGVTEAFKITDDYHTLMVSNGIDKTYLETDGFVFILTIEELKGYIGKELIKIEDSGCEFIVLLDYVGELNLKVITDSGKDILTSFDPKEYLMHQVERIPGDDVNDYALILSPEQKILKSFQVSEIYEVLNRYGIKL